MIHRKILFSIFFLNLFLSSCALMKKDIKNNDFKKTKLSQEKKIAKVIEGKEPRDFKAELNSPEKNIKEIKLTKMKINNNEKVENIEKSKKNFYLNFALGYSNLENYDVYNTSTNKAIWDDRYTKLGHTIEMALGYDFGKIRTEISYARENGRFDEYLTYFDNSITKIGNERGKLHKDFYIINIYYDFRSKKKIIPFIGLGTGFVNSVQDSAPFIPEYVRQALVLQLKGGLSYEFYDKNVLYIEGFIRNAKSHTTNDGLGTPYIYEAKEGFDSSGIQIGFRRFL